MNRCVAVGVSDPMTTPANAILFGYDELLPVAVDAVREAGGRVTAVVFPSVRRDDARTASIRSRLRAEGLDVVEQPRPGELGPFLENLRSRNPDIILVWSYPMILPASVLAVPRWGSLNLHMGLLPEYRGAHTLQWAIVNGEHETGVTLHYMDEGVDTGPMLARARIPIGSDDDVVSVLRACRAAGRELLLRGWPHFSRQRLRARPQDESRARYYPRRTRNDDRIDWHRSAERIRNLVRATARPYRGAFTRWRGTELTIRKCEVCEPAPVPPGGVAGWSAHGLAVGTGRGSLLVTDIERNGEPVSPLTLEAVAGDRLA